MDDTITDVLAEYGREVGATRKRNSWYVDNPETVTVVNLQKSQYGPAYYVNIGVNLRALDARPYPPASEFHGSERLEILAGEGNETHVLNLLDLDYRLDEERRRSEILSLLRTYASRVISDGKSLDSVRKSKFLLNKLIWRVDVTDAGIA